MKSFSLRRSAVHSVSRTSCSRLRRAARLRNRDEVRARPALLDDFAGDPVLGEPEMPVRLVVGTVKNRVFDDDDFASGLERGWRNAAFVDSHVHNSLEGPELKTRNYIVCSQVVERVFSFVLNSEQNSRTPHGSLQKPIKGRQILRGPLPYVTLRHIPGILESQFSHFAKNHIFW